jgi:L-gulonate 3-dehydrogenase
MNEHQPPSRSAFPSSGCASLERQEAQVSRGARKRTAAGPPPPGASPERPVTIVGGGSIGVAWAVVFARGGRAVGLFEPDENRRRLVPAELQRRLEALAEAGLIDEEPATIAARVEVHDDLSASVKAASYVQECAPENAGVKRCLFEDLGRLAPEDAVLASSSSALPVSAIAGDLGCRARCLVAHPGNPPYLLPVVELVPAPFTAPGAVDFAEALLGSVGMSPVRVRREVEGFVFNRLQGAVLREAYCLVRDGVATPEDVDRVMRDGPGRRWSILGPFEVAELNTRGGIDAHARLLGPAYARMGAERGQDDPWTDELVATVSKAVQARFPREAWEENVAWRDRALMALEACRRAHPVLRGPSSTLLDVAMAPEPDSKRDAPSAPATPSPPPAGGAKG